MDTIKRRHTFGNPEKFKIERAAIHKGKTDRKMVFTLFTI